MAERVEVILKPDGAVKTEVFGMKGSGCMDRTQFIRDALGAKNDGQNTFIKASYHEQEEQMVDGLPSGFCG